MNNIYNIGINYKIVEKNCYHSYVLHVDEDEFLFNKLKLKRNRNSDDS